MSEQPKENRLSDLTLEERAGIFQAAAEKGETGLLILDEDNRIEFANPMASRIIGYEQNKLIDNDFTGFLDEKNKAIFSSLKKEGKSGIVKFLHETEISTPSPPPVFTEICFANHTLEVPTEENISSTSGISPYGKGCQKNFVNQKKNT